VIKIKLKEYLVHANTFIEELKFSRKAKNIDEILMPGEREYLLEQESGINCSILTTIMV
jgi:LDH2 family malate/lactate/ureidoglycolate dehydrogenase